MNPVNNPYTPGAGSPPPELAGREEIISTTRVSFERLIKARSTQNLTLIGLRGVGKTVLLDKLKSVAEELGMTTLRIEAPENKSLPALLAPEIRKALLKLSRVELAKDLALRALKGLAGFVKALKIKYADIEVGLDYEPEKGLADNGDLELDLKDLMEAAASAAKAAGTGIVIFIDELQYVDEGQMGALITSLHACSQKQLPVLMVGAGLPQLRGKMGQAKSYSERLFSFREIGPLQREDARKAIVNPAKDEGVEFEDDALEEIVSVTGCYPYFIQEWGKHTWEVADASPIKLEDVKSASKLAVATLDESFFRVRFDRMTPSEKEYLRSMAELGKGPYKSGEIAKVLNRTVSSLGPVRSSIIKKGMIWSPNYGDTDFTVPLFDEFMKRIMPDFKS
jgi:hypothetical protein